MSGKDSGSGTVLKGPVDAGDQDMGDAIDTYLRSKGSPLAGQGRNFVTYGQKYDLDPRLLVALSGAENRLRKTYYGW